MATASLLERLENPRLILLRDSDPRVLHRHVDLVAHTPSVYLHPPAGGSELHGIREQIERDLLQPQRIRDDIAHVGIDPDVERETMLARALADHRNTLLERGAHGRVGKLELHLSRLDLRQIEDVVEQLQQVPPGAPNVLEVALLLLVQLAEQTVEEDLREADHRRQRSTQLMGHAGEELGLVAASDLELTRLSRELLIEARVLYR